MATSVNQPVTLLKGHKDSVLCLDISDTVLNERSLLATGSEDSTARIWDLRTNKAVWGFKDFEDAVTSVKFASDKCPYQFFVSSGVKVHGYDLRNVESPIMTTPSITYEANEDEINQIAINEKSTLLATCDDNGEVKVIDISTQKLVKRFRQSHNNIAMSVSFRAKKPWEVFSGGLDNQLIQWDFSRGSPIQVFDMSEDIDQQQANQLVNPPFVNSISISSDGKVVASGLGDGTIQILAAGAKSGSRGKNSWNKGRLYGGHSYSVAQVMFNQSGDKLASAGNEGIITIWDTSDLLKNISNNTTENLCPIVNQFHPEPFDKINALAFVDQLFVAGTGTSPNARGAVAIYNL
ncbi:hypothetical protein K7432_007373 [Basidiobolus ranarum]|uniref:Nucleoporin Nup159/Nup146 N-terminal domain-containing protein n=1 Tax=Basidiobolus ranarum TaxID=34480 RepID=A0ABR2W144_9FUNG